MKSPILAKTIGQLAHTKKAQDVLLMDLRKLTPMTDFFVICSGESDIQVKAISDAVEDGMIKKGVSAWHRESGSPNWVLLDYVDVVFHIFHKNTRSYYNLEKLWGDARITRLDDEPAKARPVKKMAETKSRTPRTSRKKTVS